MDEVWVFYKKIWKNLIFSREISWYSKYGERQNLSETAVSDMTVHTSLPFTPLWGELRAVRLLGLSPNSACPLSHLTMFTALAVSLSLFLALISSFTVSPHTWAVSPEWQHVQAYSIERLVISCMGLMLPLSSQPGLGLPLEGYLDEEAIW